MHIKNVTLNFAKFNEQIPKKNQKYFNFKNLDESVFERFWEKKRRGKDYAQEFRKNFKKLQICIKKHQISNAFSNFDLNQLYSDGSQSGNLKVKRAKNKLHNLLVNLQNQMMDNPEYIDTYLRLIKLSESMEDSHHKSLRKVRDYQERES